jgi:hypothetical protein
VRTLARAGEVGRVIASAADQLLRLEQRDHRFGRVHRVDLSASLRRSLQRACRDLPVDVACARQGEIHKDKVGGVPNSPEGLFFAFAVFGFEVEALSAECFKGWRHSKPRWLPGRPLSPASAGW